MFVPASGLLSSFFSLSFPVSLMDFCCTRIQLLSSLHGLCFYTVKCFCLGWTTSGTIMLLDSLSAQTQEFPSSLVLVRLELASVPKPQLLSLRSVAGFTRLFPPRKQLYWGLAFGAGAKFSLICKGERRIHCFMPLSQEMSSHSPALCPWSSFVSQGFLRVKRKLNW